MTDRVSYTAMTGNGIRAAFFDIGNVLLRFDAKRLAREFAWAARRHPLRVAKLLWKPDLIDRIERGKLDPLELFRRLESELEFKGGEERFKRLWSSDFRLLRGPEGILRRVARRIPVYLLSNTNRLHFERIEEYRFARVVKGAVLSHEVAARKPEPKIYRAALKLAKVQAHEAFFVDDLAANVQGARRLGFHAHRFRGPEALESALKRLKVL